MLIRIVSALVMIMMVLLAIFRLPASIFNLLVLIVMLGGMWEWSKLCHASKVSLALSGVILTLLYAVYMQEMLSMSLSLFLLSCGVLFWFVKAFNLSKALPANATYCLFEGAILLGLAWLAIVLLRDQFGPYYLLLGLLMVWSADSFAYFGGKKFGITKLAPSISPGKTREGVVVGVVMAMLLALAYAHWLIKPFESMGEILLMMSLTLLVALISVVGDLSESKLKRHSGVKDSSNLIPGHGGILDRIDGLIAGVVVYASYTLFAKAI